MQIGITKKPVDKLKCDSKTKQNRIENKTKPHLQPHYFQREQERETGIKIDWKPKNNEYPHQYINYIKYELIKTLHLKF